MSPKSIIYILSNNNCLVTNIRRRSIPEIKHKYITSEHVIHLGKSIILQLIRG